MNIHIFSGMRTRDQSNRAAVELRLRPHGHLDRPRTRKKMYEVERTETSFMQNSSCDQSVRWAPNLNGWHYFENRLGWTITWLWFTGWAVWHCIRVQHLVSADVSKPISSWRRFLYQSLGKVSTTDVTSRPLLTISCCSLDLRLFEDDFLNACI